VVIDVWSRIRQTVRDANFGLVCALCLQDVTEAEGADEGQQGTSAVVAGTGEAPEKRSSSTVTDDGPFVEVKGGEEEGHNGETSDEEVRGRVELRLVECPLRVVRGAATRD
jgi:hypothetical protein